MDNSIDDLLNNVKKMMDNGNIPPEVQQIMNNLKNSNSVSNTTISNTEKSNISSQISPEMLNSLSSFLGNFQSSTDNFSNSSTNNKSSPNQNNFNLDMNTILKMKSIMEEMNNKNDPRANLLYSLKPYLRDSKKSKIDQYVNMLNISKIADFMNKQNPKPKD